LKYARPGIPIAVHFVPKAQQNRFAKIVHPFGPAIEIIIVVAVDDGFEYTAFVSANRGGRAGQKFPGDQGGAPRIAVGGQQAVIESFAPVQVNGRNGYPFANFLEQAHAGKAFVP
jgi:hypothetical protein